MSCRTQILFHETFARRGFTALRPAVNRYKLALSTLEASPLASLIPVIEAPATTERDILRIHTERYVDAVQDMSLTGEGKLDGSTPAWKGMYERAERIVGGSQRGADLIAAGEIDHAFNPAGGQHHAHADRGGGFCVFNDVVAAVRRWGDAGLRRAAIVDLDGHHGDGTQALLEGEETLYISLHQYGGRTYPGTGRVDEVGRGAGAGYTLNVPLVRGTGDAAYLAIVRDTVEPLLRAYRPDAFIVQYGTDAHWADPLLRLRLTTAAFAALAAWFHAVAHELCGGRLLVVGGGGYEPIHVVGCWLLMLGELVGFPDAHAHPDAASWLAEPGEPSDPEADRASLAAAREAWRAAHSARAAHARPG